MSLIPQISALFDIETAPGRRFVIEVEEFAIDIFLKTLATRDLKIRIEQNQKIIVYYILALLTGGDKIIHKFELTDITLDAILNPLFDKQNIINMIYSFGCELKFNTDHRGLILQLRFEIKENCIEVYKQITSFPEIYYMRLDYDVKSHVFKLFNFMALQYGSPLDEIFAIIVNECETQCHMVKPVTN
jgi:hypothetical protein